MELIEFLAILMALKKKYNKKKIYQNIYLSPNKYEFVSHKILIEIQILQREEKKEGSKRRLNPFEIVFLINLPCREKRKNNSRRHPCCINHGKKGTRKIPHWFTVTRTIVLESRTNRREIILHYLRKNVELGIAPKGVIARRHWSHCNDVNLRPVRSIS